jgi:hypothetical protein
MSWIDDKANITNVLKASNYKEVEYNLDIGTEAQMSARNKYFTLEPIENDVTNITNGATLNVTMAELRISRVCNTVSQKDKAWVEILEVLEGISPYIGSYSQGLTFERNEDNNKYWVATAQFDVGAQVCN